MSATKRPRTSSQQIACDVSCQIMSCTAVVVVAVCQCDYSNSMIVWWWWSWATRVLMAMVIIKVRAARQGRYQRSGGCPPPDPSRSRLRPSTWSRSQQQKKNTVEPRLTRTNACIFLHPGFRLTHVPVHVLLSSCSCSCSINIQIVLTSLFNWCPYSMPHLLNVYNSNIGGDTHGVKSGEKVFKGQRGIGRAWALLL